MVEFLVCTLRTLCAFVFLLIRLELTLFRTLDIGSVLVSLLSHKVLRSLVIVLVYGIVVTFTINRGIMRA